MTVQEYKAKWGWRGLSVVVNDFIRRSPEFPVKAEAANLLREMLTDLENTLKAE